MIKKEILSTDKQNSSATKSSTTTTKQTNRPRRKPYLGRLSKTRKNHENSSRKTPPKKTFTKKIEKKTSLINKETIRVIPLGGVEEVGKNMIVVEYGEDILIFDCGFQFVSEETPGIDYIIPNTKYLEQNKHKIKALIVTHGHLDHIAAIPYIIDKIGNPPVYGRNLTTIMIKKRMEEFPTIKTPDLKVVNPGEKIRLGNLGIKFTEVTHSIPDSMAISVETPHGNVVVTGDLKLEHVDGIPSDKEKKNWGDVGKENNLLLIADSTNVEKPGWSIPEKNIMDNIDNLIRDIDGRIIIGTFASQFERMIQIIKIAEKYNKKVVTEGRSIKTNIEIAKLAGLLKPKEGTIIQPKDITNYPPDKILILATGAQGEEFAALMRMATKKNKYVQLNKRDTVILSSSIVPGNEVSVRKLKDNLYRHDLKIISYQVSDVHSTGHGNANELAW